MFEYDELQLYKGRNIKINNDIEIKIPTIGQIEEFGERRYFNAVYSFTSVGADLKWQLWDLGIDYTTVEDYDLFIKLISQLVSSKREMHDDYIKHPEKYNTKFDDDELKDMLINPMQLLFDIDFSDFKPFIIKESEQIVLYSHKDNITFDRLTYAKSVDVIRKIHYFKRNSQIPANEKTKMDLIEDARDDAMASARKPYKSMLRPLISTLQVQCGQCGDEKIWNMPVSAFFDNVKRVSRIQDATMLLQGAYSGFASLKGVDTKRLDIFGEI